MPGPDHHDEEAHQDPATREPSIAEIADLTSRLRHLGSSDATAAERAAFIADKNALLARIPGYTKETDDHTEPTEGHTPGSPPVAAAQVPAEDDADQARTEQLWRWHSDDHAEAGAQDDAGWSQ